jgi:hypothetical protein
VAKLLLLSMLVATVAIPIWFAHDARAKRGLRKTVGWFLAFLTAWVLALLFLYPRLL